VIIVIFDTNIFISAFEFGGVPRDAFLLAASGLFELYTSPILLDERTGVLHDRFGYSHEKVQDTRKRLKRLCTLVEPAEAISDCSDPDDNRVLECAVSAKAGYIVTGDRALLRLSPFRGIQIVTAAQLLERKPWDVPGYEEG
jgi:putative PIN family toxin of toxin-antitoxin system